MCDRKHARLYTAVRPQLASLRGCPARIRRRARGRVRRSHCLGSAPVAVSRRNRVVRLCCHNADRIRCAARSRPSGNDYVSGAGHQAPPWWDILARMRAATIAVLLITAAASFLGAKWSELLSTIPVYRWSWGLFFAPHRWGGAAHSFLNHRARTQCGPYVRYRTVRHRRARQDAAPCPKRRLKCSPFRAPCRTAGAKRRSPRSSACPSKSCRAGCAATRLSRRTCTCGHATSPACAGAEKNAAPCQSVRRAVAGCC